MSEEWKMVPIKATQEMRDALRTGSRRDVPSDELCDVRWVAAIAVVPQPAPQKCDCIQKMNEALKPKNASLGLALQITEDMNLRSRLCVAVEKIDKSKRKAPPTVVANYCPFCGGKLP